MSPRGTPRLGASYDPHDPHSDPNDRRYTSVEEPTSPPAPDPDRFVAEEQAPVRYLDARDVPENSEPPDTIFENLDRIRARENEAEMRQQAAKENIAEQMAPVVKEASRLAKIITELHEQFFERLAALQRINRTTLRAYGGDALERVLNQLERKVNGAVLFLGNTPNQMREIGIRTRQITPEGASGNTNLSAKALMAGLREAVRNAREGVENFENDMKVIRMLTEELADRLDRAGAPTVVSQPVRISEVRPNETLVVESDRDGRAYVESAPVRVEGL